MLRDRSTARRLRDSLDRRRDAESDILFATYVRPHGRGEHVVTLPGSATERIVGSSIGRVTFKPGATVPLGRQSGEATEFVIGKPPPGRAGASGFPISAPQPGRIDLARITSTAEVETGEIDQLITLTGFGFVAGDVMIAVVSSVDLSPDPYATIHDTTIVSSSEANIEVDVDADAPVSAGGGYRITIAIYRGWEVS